MTLTGEVDPGGFRESGKIHAIVFEEAAIFDGQHSANHDSRNLVVMDYLTFGALIAFEQRSDHLRFKFIGVELPARTSADSVNFSQMNVNGGSFRAVIGTSAGLDLDRSAGNLIAAHRRLAAFLRVSGVPQSGSEFL